MDHKTPIWKALQTAMTCSECTEKHGNKASYNADYIISDLIDFFGDGWKETEMQIEIKNIYICKKYCNDWKLVSC